jgi:beta-1,2-mannosidase
MERGIFLIYNASAHGRPDLGLRGNVWTVAQSLFAPQDPTRLIDRTDADFFHPERDFEIVHAGSATGGSGNVTFVESLVWFHDVWRFDYGCADSIVASAVYRPGALKKKPSRHAE